MFLVSFNAQALGLVVGCSVPEPKAALAVGT